MYHKPGGPSPRRPGAVLLLAAACLTGILFLTAMAIDSGNLMAARRHAQNCADAAAINGCLKIASARGQNQTPSSSTIQDAVKLSATNNGFTDGTNCTITVNYPPTSGSFANDNNSVEVFIKFDRANLVVGGSNSVTVRSVASCNPASATIFPMLLTDPTGADSFWIHSGALTLSTAPVQVNSNNNNAAVVDGSTSSAANATVKAVGGSSGSFTPAAKSGGTPVADPYASLPTPSTSGMTTYTTSTYTPNSSGNVTLNPGYYPNGIYISSGNVTLNPGIYYVANGNFWINTPGTVTGNQVMIYHAGSNSSAQLYTGYGLDVGICLCPTNGSYTFTPPTSGPYAGVSFFQSRTYSGEAFYDFWGTGNLNVGLQYFPGGTLRAWSANNGGQINCNQLVAKDFKLTGPHEIYGNTQNGGFSRLTWNASRATTSPATSVYLAE